MIGVAGLGLLGAALWLGLPTALSGLAGVEVRAQYAAVPTPAVPDARFAGLQWTFVRIHYTAWTVPSRGGFAMYDEPWYIDAPAAEQNLSRRIKTATAIQVEDPILLTLDDPRLFEYPWIYFVEPSSMRLQDNELPILREFLLRGGSAYMDDFHGPAEWAMFEREMKKLFPDAELVELPFDHPVFHQVYEFPGGLPKIHEHDGGPARAYGIVRDGRLCVFFSFDCDLGDGLEDEEVHHDPPEKREAAMRMAMNIVHYALTH